MSRPTKKIIPANAIVLGTFRLGSVVVQSPQTTIYSASRLFEPPEREHDRIEARAYVINDIDPKLGNIGSRA